MGRLKFTPKRIWNKGINPRTRHICAGLRRAVYEKHGSKCKQCGSSEEIEIDHIIPWSKGGLTVLENLQPLCWLHNGQKGSRV
jgi:5-methylcytosine-specific restriction endonuclease McrA